jgi:hypothetical protein
MVGDEEADRNMRCCVDCDAGKAKHDFIAAHSGFLNKPTATIFSLRGVRVLYQ